MKRSFLYLGVVVLLSMTACKTEPEAVVDNPRYNPVDNTVTADFVLNISTTTGKDTKTTAEFAQVDSPFLGMQDVHLLTYALDYTSTNHGNFFYRRTDDNGKVVPATRDYNLGSLFPAGAVDKDNSSRTLELALPLGTNCVVLYGKALKTHSDDLQGSTFAKGDPSDLTGLTFTLSPRLSNHAAFEAGSYFFSRLLTCFLLSGVVDEREGGFWGNATGLSDRSYAFWFPIPQSDEVVASLPTNPTDQQVVVSSVDGVTYTFYRGQLSWKQLGTMYDYANDGLAETDPEKVAKTENGTNGVWMELDGLNEVLGSAYSNLVTIKSSGTLKELRAGSASAVLRTVQDLYSIIERAAESDPVSWSEQAAKELSLVIKEKLELFFEMKNGTLDFLKKDGAVNIKQLKDNLSVNTRPDEWAAYKSILDEYLDASYFPGKTNDGFPVNVGLPVGGAILTSVISPLQTDVDYFNYTEDIPAYGFGTATFPIANYRYPAELMYWGNSAIRVSSAAKTESSYPFTINQWNTEGWWTQWDSFASVKSDTRTVAMVNNINYGTALLESTVVYGDTKIVDNNHALHPSEKDNEITVSSLTNEKGLYVTGVIVGGQADVMGWNYMRKETSVAEDFAYDAVDQKYTGLGFEGNEFNKMIFDKVTDTYKVGTTAEKKIYTMVWDNYDASLPAKAQSDVYIGLELVNNTGQDLWGEMNLIRNGGTFYLLGKMDLSDAVAAARADNAAAFTDLSRSYYCYPPFDMSTGETINAPRVFMQDYVTKAKLVFGKDALKHAYVTVPDLRSGQVSLGLSIDMDWTPGLAFEVEMGWLEDN